MLKCYGGAPDRQTCTEDSQQDAPNPAIPAMAAGPAAPDHPLNSPRFRLIQQLLPTFCGRSPGLWTEGHFAALRNCSSSAITARSTPQNAGDKSSDCEHANRQCRHLHKYVWQWVNHKIEGRGKTGLIVGCQPTSLHRPSRATQFEPAKRR